MSGNANPIRIVTGLSDSGDMSNVSKGGFIAWAEGRVAQIMASDNEVAATDLSSQSAIFLLSTGRFYAKDTEEIGVGERIVRDANGVAFVTPEIVGLDGADGAP